jgi:hypothetical protein
MQLLPMVTLHGFEVKSAAQTFSCGARSALQPLFKISIGKSNRRLLCLSSEFPQRHGRIHESGRVFWLNVTDGFMIQIAFYGADLGEIDETVRF